MKKNSQHKLESIIKISKSLIGRIPWNKNKNLSVEHKKNLSLAHKDKKLSNEHIKNLSKANTGKKRSEEQKNRMSKSHKGKKLSLEHIKKLSESHKGHLLSNETKRKISGKLKGRIFSEERNKKISEANRKRKLSEKTKQKIRKAQIGEKSPHWRGGISKLPYSFEFNKKLKEKIRKRDNYTCQLTGKTEKELGEKLSIHHIDYDKMNCKESNLISLSKDSNSKVNFNREDWTKYFKNILKKNEHP